jgi:pimeloyl-ACP methyl ester carboxylesterase
MDIILIPGLWLDASSWDEVTPALERAGHRVRPLTLPGLESADADRRGIGLRDHVDAVIAAIDEADEPVVLVGHSGGGAIAHAAADARPKRVARVVYVDAGPLGEGQSINDQLPVVDDEIPLPDWSEFDEADLRDLDDDYGSGSERGRCRHRRVSRTTSRCSPTIAGTTCRPRSSRASSRATSSEWIAQGHAYVAELTAMRDVEYIDLPTGHWPLFTKPVELGQAILSAVDRRPVP